LLLFSFKCPVALTAAAWVKCVAVPSAVSCQDEAGRLWDVLTMLRLAVRGQPDGAREVRFGVHVRSDNRDRTPPLVRLKALCGPGDEGEPVLTVMLPDEDRAEVCAHTSVMSCLRCARTHASHHQGRVGTASDRRGTPRISRDTRGERERLTAALAERGSIRAAARALGVGESTLRGRLKRYGIEAPKSRRGRRARAATAA
jgi:hypothetical protein